VTLHRFCFFSVLTDAEERASDAEDSAQDKDDTDEDAAQVVWKRDELVRGESDDDSDASEPEEPEVELQPWFVPEGYKVNVLCINTWFPRRSLSHSFSLAIDAHVRPNQEFYF